MAVVLVGLFASSALAPPLARRLGREAGYVLAVVYAVGAGVVAWQLPAIVDGQRIELTLPWVPALGIRVTLVLDGLSALFSLLVLGIGALVMAYTARYVGPHGSHGGVYALLTLFAASMLGLVLAGDAVLLFVFWELTSVTSFLLIGGKGDEASRAAATRAFLVTGLGGLALFAGLLLLASVSGTTDLATTMARADGIAAHGVAPAILLLVLAGAFTKSAQVPFHFWLPGAMVAPTPVSTYLHAATMVKAGIYLLARLSPLFAGRGPWLYVVVLTGLVTAVVGAGIALKQHDLKALLAYSTVSQLGFIVALVGVGTFPALAAASIHTLAHALYKATLFMVVGIIDREAGSRDIRELSGLRRAMPLTAAATGLAGLSMAGFPPFFGFVSKEEAFGAFLGAPGAGWFGPLAGALAVTASIMTFAYGARIFDGAFEGPLRQHLYEPARSFLAPAAVTALGGLVLGLVVSSLDPFVERAAEAALGQEGRVHLALWHGITPALWMSATTIAGGSLLFAFRRWVDGAVMGLRAPVSGAGAFDRAYDGVIASGKAVGSPFLSDAPGSHLAWVIGAVTAAGLASWWAWRPGAPGPSPGSGPFDWALLALVAVAAFGVARARSRIGAAALIGIAGFLVAVVYASLGGPDLAMTQLLVETLTVAFVVLVFRHLSPSFAVVGRARRLAAVAGAAVVGALTALAAFGLTGRRPLSDPGGYFLRAGPEEAGGRNVVNTILVDFRALDTLGEITVLAVAAIGVVALVLAGRERS